MLQRKILHVKVHSAKPNLKGKLLCDVNKSINRVRVSITLYMVTLDECISDVYK